MDSVNKIKLYIFISIIIAFLLGLLIGMGDSPLRVFIGSVILFLLLSKASRMAKGTEEIKKTNSGNWKIFRNNKNTQ